MLPKVLTKTYWRYKNMTVKEIQNGDIISFYLYGGCVGKTYYDDVKVIDAHPANHSGYFRIKKANGATPLVYYSDVRNFTLVRRPAAGSKEEQLATLNDRLHELTQQATQVTKDVTNMSESMSQFAFNLGAQHAAVLTSIEEFRTELAQIMGKPAPKPVETKPVEEKEPALV